MEILTVENIVRILLDKVQCSRISDLFPETVIRFNQSFPVPSGITKCYRSVCDTRQIAFTSTSDGFVRTVETSCSTTDSQNLDFTSDQASSEIVD